jgi:hypothetical protein
MNFYGAELSALRPTPSLEGQVPVFMFPCDRVSQLYPQHRVPFYDTLCYGGGILSRLHTGGIAPSTISMECIHVLSNSFFFITQTYNVGSCKSVVE